MTELKRLREGQKKFIEILYKENFPSISHWIKKNSGSEKDAEDLFQDALVVVYQKAKDPEFALNCKLSTFIFGVVKKMWLHKLRTKDRYLATDFTLTETFSSSNQAIIDHLIEEHEIDILYKSKFKKLTDECRSILSLFFNGSSMSQVMESMGFQTENMTRKKKFRCKEELIKLIKKDPRYGELMAK